MPTLPSPARTLRPILVVALALGLVASGVLLATAQEPTVKAGDADSPTYINYAGPEPLGQDAAEPSIGVNHETGQVLYQALLETLRVTFDDTVDPPTAEWMDVSPGTTSITTLDPILHTDSVTGRTFVSQLLPPCSIYATTDDDGESYIEQTATGCGPGANFDHQTIVAGPAVNPALSPLYEGRSVYYCSQLVVEAACARSVDGGRTFPQGVPMYNIERVDVIGDVGVDFRGCAGLHGHLEVAPNGFAYMPNFRCNDMVLEGSGPAAVVSEDDGLTWDIRRPPDGTSDNFDSDPTASVDGANRTYFAYENENNEVFVTTSEDAGRTWTPSVDLGAPFGIKNATFPASIAGSDGRAAISFLGTPVEAPLDEEGKPENQLEAFDPSQGDPEKGWHLYVATTYDGGKTWETVDATPTDPVQRGCIWWGSARDPGDAPVCTQTPDRNLLDFTEMAVDAQGRVLVAYADGCVRTCVDDPAPPPYENNSDFRDDVAVIARQHCGRGLFAELDDDPAGPLQACERSELPTEIPTPLPTLPSETPSPDPSPDPSETPSTPPSGSPDDAEVERVNGASRAETAVQVSQTAFPDGADTVVLARADLYPDALTGAPLATDRDAPLLLTDPATLTDVTADEIERLGAETAVLLGGTDAISQDVADQLDQSGLDVERVGGANRFDTAVRIAGTLPDGDVAFLAEGANADPSRGFPDALSAAPYAAATGRPILLATLDDLPDETREALTERGVTETIVVGGAAAVSDAVLGEVESAGHGPRRLAGGDRYATAATVFAEATEVGAADPATTWLADGTDWPDALTAGPAVAAGGDAFLLVDPEDLGTSEATEQTLAERRDDIDLIRIVGGDAAISAQVEDQVREVLGAD